MKTKIIILLLIIAAAATSSYITKIQVNKIINNKYNNCIEYSNTFKKYKTWHILNDSTIAHYNDFEIIDTIEVFSFKNNTKIVSVFDYNNSSKNNEYIKKIDDDRK